MRSIGEVIGMGSGAVHRALDRLAAAGLYDPVRRDVNLAVAIEFVRHAAKFVLHRELGGPARGVPTAWGAPPLSNHLAENAVDSNPVWPSSTGTARGPSLKPLIENAPELVERDPWIGAALALLDAITIGDARTRSLSADLLMEQLESRTPLP
jgi:hypothetical protein